MIDINGWEIVIILVLVLLVVGPERLPEFLFRAGKLMRQFRQMTDEATSEITREFRAAAQMAEAELKTPLSDTLAEVKAPFDDLARSLTAAATLPAAGTPTPSGVDPDSAPASGEPPAAEATMLPEDLPSIAPPSAPYPPLVDGPADAEPDAPDLPPPAADEAPHAA